MDFADQVLGYAVILLSNKTIHFRAKDAMVIKLKQGNSNTLI
jgi:hypothetical protein